MSAAWMTEVAAHLQAAGTGSSTAALFTLLGVGITATVSLVAIFVKYVLDSRSETMRHGRQKEAEEREHVRNIEKLRIEAAERRSDVASGRQVQAVARFLAASLAIYSQIVAHRREWESEADDVRYRNRLLAIDSTDAQIAFEEVRLVSSDDVTSKANLLWQHLRGREVPRGLRLDRNDWIGWKNAHWSMRKDLIGEHQAELRAEGWSSEGSV